MRAALAEARLGLRLRRRRSLLTALGIALAAAMLGASLVVSDSLGLGFARAARASDLADIIVRFNPQSASRVAQRIEALPDIASFSLRQEVTDAEVNVGEHESDSASVEVVGPGRRGYAIVGGRDLSLLQPGEVVVERGLATGWGIRLGTLLEIGGLGSERVVGFSQAPDNVSYPLAVPRVYVSQATVQGQFGAQQNPNVNLAQIWLRDPRYLNEVLVQARSISYGLQGLQFVTRSGVRVLLDQAAGIVIDLLVALSLIALATAAVMLASSARAEVQRRLDAIGIRRAIGASRVHLTSSQALEALLVAAPAATVGMIAGTVATYGPTARLLTMLNEPPAGLALLAPLLGAWLASVAIPVAAAAWPAWRAAGRPPVELLQSAELAPRRRRFKSPRLWRTGLTVLGGRLVGARVARLVTTATALGFATGFVLLMLALAAALTALETNPGALGQRYQLTAALPPSAVPKVRAIHGVQAAAPRYEEMGADSFSLGETIDVIAYPGNHVTFEAPPLAGGTRLHGSNQAEVGVGLADALGLAPGSTLAIQLQSGKELRLTVSGLVSSLDHDGRVAYVPASALLAGDPSAPEDARDPDASGRERQRDQRCAWPECRPSQYRDRTRRGARQHAPRDPPCCRDRRRPGMRVRADSSDRADRAGTPPHDRRSPSLWRRATRRAPSAHRGGGGAGDPCGAAGHLARAAAAGTSDVEACRQLRDTTARRGAGRDRRRAGGAGPRERGRGLVGGAADHAGGRDRGACGDMTGAITRRDALRLTAAALLAAGCGSSRPGGFTVTGSTLESTWSDSAGTGVLQLAAGEPLIARTELGPPRPHVRTIASLAHVTDAHVLDAASPARVTFLNRLGVPFQSTFRPQETLTDQVFAGAVRAIRALAPDAVIQGGDLIDNDQRNELRQALEVLRGGTVRPGSGRRGYFGVQSEADADPFYYRPDLDAPRHPGLLRKAAQPFTSVGLRGPWYPVLGDHDILVAGEIVPTAETRALALGDEAVWELPPGLTLPPGMSLGSGSSPDGPLDPALVNLLLQKALAGPKVRVPADPSRWQMDADQVVSRLRGASGAPTAAGARSASGTPTGAATLDYSADIGPRLRLIVLDLARRGGGSGGLVRPAQPAWLASQLVAAGSAGKRWVIVVSHQPLVGSEGGDQLLSILDRDPRVIAAIAGHTHRNLISPRPTSAGGYWLIETASLIDYPQQARALRVIETAGGGVALQTWMLDHNFPGSLGTISRQLAYLDAQGGRPQGLAGARLDRNVTLYRS